MEGKMHCSSDVARWTMNKNSWQKEEVTKGILEVGREVVRPWNSLQVYSHTVDMQICPKNIKS